MKFRAGVVILGVAIAVALALFAAKKPANAEPAILPVPEHLVLGNGRFRLTQSTRIAVDPSAEPTGALLAGRLRTATHYPFPLTISSDPQATNGTILLTTNGAKSALGREGYDVDVSIDQVVLRATDAAGLFNATQTLLELLPVQDLSTTAARSTEWTIPTVRIEDRPRFPWRGAMLDVSRHFFNVSEIKQFLDAMALHKLNTFHWHLTDDQGWRLEIKKYPRLTEVGAWRKRIGFNLDPKSSTAYGPDGRYGGFYTQTQVREIVAYAKARNITIVPEIEMPGHSSAALAAYPQFSCTGGPYTTDMSESVSAGVYCAGQDETFAFLEDVLTEVMELFPSKFIHIGGDEVPRHNWHNCPRCQARIRQEQLRDERELESYFVRRIEKFLNSHGRRVIGWSEIRTDNLSPSTAVMDWIGGGLEAARAGHDVVMCPEEFCYLDFYQSKNRADEPPAAGAYLPLSKAYSFEPVLPGLPAGAQFHILGGQGNIWTEYIPSMSQAEYMAFPRLCALAEVFWSPKKLRNWRDFTQRLATHQRRLEQLGINYRRDPTPQ